MFLRQTFIDTAHHAAAIGLFVCILAVAIVDASRHQGERLSTEPGPWEEAKTVVNALAFHDLYASVTVAMLIAALIDVPLVMFEVHPAALPWVEQR